MEEKNMEQKKRNERMHIYPEFKIFNWAFLGKITHYFFVTFVNFLNDLVLVLI